MTKIKTECPDCGHEYEIELDKSISEVISQGIEKGKTNLSESEKDKIKEEAAKNTLSAQKLINKKAVGIYNVSLGKKVYLNKLINWLNLFNKNKYKCIDIPKS